MESPHFLHYFLGGKEGLNFLADRYMNYCLYFLYILFTINSKIRSIDALSRCGFFLHFNRSSQLIENRPGIHPAVLLCNLTAHLLNTYSFSVVVIISTAATRPTFCVKVTAFLIKIFAFTLKLFEFHFLMVFVQFFFRCKGIQNMNWILWGNFVGIKLFRRSFSWRHLWEVCLKISIIFKVDVVEVIKVIEVSLSFCFYHFVPIKRNSIGLW